MQGMTHGMEATLVSKEIIFYGTMREFGADQYRSFSSARRRASAFIM